MPFTEEYAQRWNPTELKHRISRQSDELMLAKFLTDDPITRHVFRGTFAVNERVQRPTRYPVAYVYNTQPRPISGHWICLYMYLDKRGCPRAEFFCSYGMEPPDQLLSMVRQWTRYITWNRRWFQYYKSNVCGMYVVYYLTYRCRGWSLQDIQKHFDSHSVLNDRLVESSLFNKVSQS